MSLKNKSIYKIQVSLDGIAYIVYIYDGTKLSFMDRKGNFLPMSQIPIKDRRFNSRRYAISVFKKFHPNERLEG